MSLVNVETMQDEDIPLLNDKKEIAPVSIDNMILGEDSNLWYSVKEQLCKINLTTREVSKMSVSCLEDELIRTLKCRDGALWMVLINKTVVFDTRTGMCKQLRLPYND